LRVQPETDIPAGMAIPSKQISVKNRRMYPPRPALSNRGTVFPDTVGKTGLSQSLHRRILCLRVPHGSFIAKKPSCALISKAPRSGESLHLAVRQHTLAGLLPV
jgi:hypothetical protein